MVAAALTMPKKGANLGVRSDSIVAAIDGGTVSKAGTEPEDDTGRRGRCCLGGWQGGGRGQIRCK